MKLNLLREHYYSNDNGATWTPKDGFNNIKEIREAGFAPREWRIYVCNFCNKLHKATPRDEEEVTNDASG